MNCYLYIFSLYCLFTCLQLSSANSASIFVNAGLTHFDATPRQTSTFSGISPRVLPTVPENETTTPSEEHTQEPTSIPPLLTTSNYSALTSAENTDTQPTLDPFMSLDQSMYNSHNIDERPSSPEIFFTLPSKSEDVKDVLKPELSNTAVSEMNQKKQDPLSNVKPVVYDNPWDLVPDQPNINALSASVSGKNQGR